MHGFVVLQPCGGGASSRLLQSPYHAARIAHGKHAGRDVLRHHAPCTDDGSFANRHPGQYDHVGGYPHIDPMLEGPQARTMVHRLVLGPMKT